MRGTNAPGRRLAQISALLVLAGCGGNADLSPEIAQLAETLAVRVHKLCACEDGSGQPLCDSEARRVDADESLCAEQGLADLDAAADYLECRLDAERVLNRCLDDLRCADVVPRSCQTTSALLTSDCDELAPAAAPALWDCSEDFFFGTTTRRPPTGPSPAR